MNGKHRFHIIFTFRYLRYGLVLCLVPMIRALIAFDLASLWTALSQDAAILVLCTAAALMLWSAASFRFGDGCIFVEQGLLYRTAFRFDRSGIAALEIARPIVCRMLGASRLTIYFRGNSTRRHYTLYLSRKDARQAADELMPSHSRESLFAPTGFERLTFIMLSANILTSCAFAYFGLRQLDEVLGGNFEKLAFDTLREAGLFAARWLPTGLAFLVTLGFAGMGIAMLYSLLKTAGFHVCRNGGVIISRGGLFSITERRILLSCVSSCDICVTPAARLLHRYPVYLTAGSFRAHDLPVLVCRKGQEQLLEMLLPAYCRPEGPLCTPRRKSPGQYLWRPGVLFVFLLALCCVASYVMPPVLPMLLVPLVLSLVSLFAGAEGFFREGFYKNENRTLSVCFTRFFTRHDVCVFTPDLSYTIIENPFSVSRGRCNLKIHLPCGIRYRVRSVLQYAAQNIPFTL